MSNTKQVYIGNLNPDATERDLEDKFMSYGPLRKVWVARRPPGFAYITFENHDDAARCVKECDGIMILDKPIRCEWSSRETREERRSYRRYNSPDRSYSHDRYRHRDRSDSYDRYRHRDHYHRHRSDSHDRHRHSHTRRSDDRSPSPYDSRDHSHDSRDRSHDSRDRSHDSRDRSHDSRDHSHDSRNSKSVENRSPSAPASDRSVSPDPSVNREENSERAPSSPRE